MYGRLFSEYPGLSGWQLPLLLGSLPGLPAVLPVLLGTCLTAGLVRDGGSAASDTEPEGLGLLAFSLGDLALQLLAAWLLVPIPLVLASFLLPGLQLCWCRLGSTRGFGVLG